MTETINIDVPVFFPCDPANVEQWKGVKHLMSSVEVVRNGKTVPQEYWYYPSLAYDGLGEYAMDSTFPVNTTMVNFSTRSQSPLMTPLFIRSLPWQSVKFRGKVHCKFQPSENINGQVRVLVSESPVSLSPGNITSLMSGTPLSHSFSCSGVEAHTFHLFNGEKIYDNALNGMVTPGTISYNEMVRDKDIVNQYNNRCDMFSAHLLFDSVTTANQQGINAFAPGTKIGILTFSFVVDFVVSRGSAYTQFLQDAMFRVIRGRDIGGDQPTPGPSPEPEPKPEEPEEGRKCPLPMTLQNVGQNLFEAMTQDAPVNRGLRRERDGRNAVRLSRNVSINHPILKRLLMQPESKFARAALQHYRELHAGGRAGESAPAKYVSDIAGKDLLLKASYSTGFAGCDKEGKVAADADSAVQEASRVKVYPHPGVTVEYMDNFYGSYKNDTGAVVMSEIMTSPSEYMLYVTKKDGRISEKAKGKDKEKQVLKEGRYYANGVMLRLTALPQMVGDEEKQATARVNASGVVELDDGQVAVVLDEKRDKFTPLAMGTSLILPGNWARQIQKQDGSYAEAEYTQYAYTGFCGGVRADGEEKEVSIPAVDAAFTVTGTDVEYKVTFGGDEEGDAARISLFQTYIPHPEVEVAQANAGKKAREGRKASWIGTVGTLLSIGGKALSEAFTNGRKGEGRKEDEQEEGLEDATVPFVMEQFMSGWQKSAIGKMDTLAEMVSGFLMGPEPVGMQYAVGQQSYDGEGHLMQCSLSASFHSVVPAYVSVSVENEFVTELKTLGDGENVLPNDLKWWSSVMGTQINANEDAITYTDDDVPITFKEFFGEAKFVHAVTPLVSRYPITDEHFAECAITACPVGDNTVVVLPQKYFVSMGNDAHGGAAGTHCTSIFPGFGENSAGQSVFVAQCNFIGTSNASVNFSFNLPDRLPFFSNGSVELEELRTGDKFYVYFQVGSQFMLDGTSTKYLAPGNTIYTLLGDGLTGKQPDIYTRPIEGDEDFPGYVTDDSDDHPYACCPFLSMTGVKTCTSIASAVDSNAEVFNPTGEEEAVEV